MTDDRCAFNFLRGKKLFHVRRHQRIIHCIVMRRRTVIPQIRNEDVKLLRQLRRDAKPIVRRTKKSVQQNERLTVTELFEVKLHFAGYGSWRAVFKAARILFGFCRQSSTR